MAERTTAVRCSSGSCRARAANRRCVGAPRGDGLLLLQIIHVVIRAFIVVPQPRRRVLVVMAIVGLYS